MIPFYETDFAALLPPTLARRPPLGENGRLPIRPGQKGTVPICAQHPSGRSGKWGLSPCSLERPMDWRNDCLLFVAAVLGGAVNAVAGGGTLLTFPALLWAGQVEIVANATSTVALWPGALSSFWTYRCELRSSWRELAVLAIPSFAGGIVGAVLLLGTHNATFAAIVPYLILLATLLFIFQTPLARWRAHRAAGPKRGLSRFSQA